MAFIPQALADPASRSVIFVWTNEEMFRRYFADKVKTIDAPGVSTHPRSVKVGDVIDWYPTGWNKFKVAKIDFTPASNDIPDYHRSGSYRFSSECGSSINVRVDGRTMVDAPIYTFPGG